MDKKELIVGGIIVIVAVVVAGIVFAPTTDAQSSNLSILNKGDVGENGTIYVKLTDNDNASLSGKTVHIKISGSDGKVVYDDDVTTHATGVAMVKLKDADPGKYNVEASFDGDENYTSSSISKKINVVGEDIEEVVDDMDLVNQTLQDTSDDWDSQDSQTDSYSQSYSQSSYSSSSSSYSSSSSSSSSSGDMKSYDENGKEVLPEYDEDGNQI